MNRVAKGKDKEKKERDEREESKIKVWHERRMMRLSVNDD